ncbi:MAG TPA: hypothetical protein VGZ25_11335, partial [Gemmataceae bacterium]|nr:hypothetical protein [Gemmataceae bacterium]
ALSLFYTRRISSTYWLILSPLYVAGLAVGIYCGFYAEYSLSPSLIAFSAPIPAGFFHLEDGQWIDFVTPAPAVTAFSNVIIVALSVPLPIIGYLLWRGRPWSAEWKHVR